MTQQILLYGDSLSWGFTPDTRWRLRFEARWPGAMEAGRVDGLHLDAARHALLGPAPAGVVGPLIAHARA